MKKAISVLFLMIAALAAQPRIRVSEYVLVLKDEPVARTMRSRAALGGTAARAHVARLQQAQEGVRAELRRRRVGVTGAAQLLINAVMVSATPETAAQLRQIPGVSYVAPAPRFKPDLDRAATLQKAEAAWSAVGGASNAGAGIKIGIIDSGIDQNHPGFQDPSLQPPAGFPKGEMAYTNNKVIVARSYVSLVAAGFSNDPVETSRPDDYTPRDRMGHGTAIAMIAAGAQNTGPAGTIQGIAPKAFLGNYKVFGSPGVNNFSRFAAVNKALEDALADGMDIVTLALSEGDPPQYAPLDVENDPNTCGGQCDVISQAVESAVANGMVVVVSAGNGGNIGKNGATLASIHTPGTAPSAITVGASVNSHAFYNTLRVPGFLNIRALFSDGPHIASPLSAPIRDAGAACQPPAAGSLPGAIALIERGACTFTDKILNAQNAGAIGVVVYQSAGQAELTSALFVQSTGIPSMMIGNADGLSLKNYLASNPSARADMDPALTPVEIAANTVWAGSSRGPSPGSFGVTQTYDVKPELVAVGANVYTAAQKLDPNGDGYHVSGYTSVAGTSYAVPMVAGAVALVKQKFPQMRAGQLKSAVVNTASPDVSDANGAARANSAGAGMLDVGKAVSVGATLEPATISFGQIASTTVDITRTMRITNVTGTQMTFNLQVQRRDNDSSANVQVSPGSVTLAAGAFQDVSVSLRGTRSAPGIYEGVIEVTGAGPALRLPYLYMVASGVPADVYPILNGGFTGGVTDVGWLLGVRVVDQFGVPVVGTPLTFNVAGPGGQISIGDAQTYRLGIAKALVNLGNTPGDKIFTATVGGMTVQFDGYARNYPDFVAGGVKNAASFEVGKGFAPGSYISIFGTDLADATQVVSTPSLPVSLSDVSASFDADGVSQPGRLHFVSPGQVNVQIPWEFQGKSTVRVKVTIGALQSYVIDIPLAEYSPGIFEIAGLAAAQDATYALIDRSRPARRGETILIYANGLGPVTNRPASGEVSPGAPFAQTTALPTVTIGAVQARVDFSGMTPGIVGLYQLNVVVPDVPAGNQPLALSIGGVNATISTLPVQ